MLVHMSVTYVDNIRQFLIVSLFLTDKKVCRVFECSSIFYYSQKMAPRNYFKFCVKNEIKCERTFGKLSVAFNESTMSSTQVQLYYNRFKEGREDVKYIVLVARGRQQAMKTLKQRRN